MEPLPFVVFPLVATNLIFLVLIVRLSLRVARLEGREAKYGTVKL